ncbi:CAP domain-containing protein [Actinomadura graeca]|uniref:CAP domain-containing protein n=1 Tax=Actinomadura graeca TaxID=2750812 RepID=A0ABX8R0B8_9ACTN|nr:CAP domain-containing protein [Actinomadura graeca]QXJ23709.1 CAP domain-containing protein [Actinomadura graeca]
MIAAGVAVTAASLAIGTGIALDRLVLPELRSEPASVTGPTAEPQAVESSGLPDIDTRAPADPTAKPVPTATEKAPPLRSMPARARPSARPSPTKTRKPEQPLPTGPVGGGSGPEATVVALTNSERVKAGCKALRPDARLAAAARKHSADMAANGYFDHTSRNGDSPWKRMEDAGYPSPGAENIAKGYATAAAVVAGWMKSPGHRANILNCDLRAIGVGMADGAGGPLWTQDFGWK